MALMEKRDWRLSMRIGRRRADGDEVHTLRSMLVHRLRDNAKAVLRLSLSATLGRLREYSIHCEPCNRWFNCEPGGTQFTCPLCSGVFVIEFAVFARVEEAL